MRTARTIAAGLGIMILLGVGAASLSRAQQSGATSKQGSQAQKDIRERLLRLRSEIDVLQADYDAARADFIKSLEIVSASDLAMFDMIAAGVIQIGQNKDNETSAIIANIRSLGANGLKGIDNVKLAKAVDGLAKGEKGAARDLINALKDFQNPFNSLVEVKRSHFGNLSIELNRKKLDLDDFEKQYRREDR